VQFHKLYIYFSPSFSGPFLLLFVILSQSSRLESYLEILGQELAAKKNGTKEATYSMYCFWSGEVHLGGLDGVLFTESGFSQGHEIVTVTYDPKLIKKEELDAHAEKGSCTAMDSNKSRTSEKDVNYQLKNSPYKYLPLSKLQRTKINVALGTGKNPDQFLSPSQLAWLNENDRNEILYLLELEAAWQKMELTKSEN